MLTNLQKTPFPYFGGKADAADVVWAALGDVDHYVEPFAGSLAVLLRRPHPCNRTYHGETVNDLDGLLCNAWRAIQMHPDETADAASWPVCEADLHARHLALVRWRETHELEHLMGDPAWCDPVMAGWWIWGTCCWIGGGFCSGQGGWTADADGRLVRADGASVSRKRPHLGNNGQGVNRPQAREPGISRPRPHLSNDGQGVNRPQAREPGVSKQLPHLSGGRGVNCSQAREPGIGHEPDYHTMTMPEVRRWFRFLSARLRHVRILNGDWTRAVTSGASKTINVRMGGVCGVFLDPPYSTEAGRDMSLYAHESGTVAHDVRAWCAKHGSDPQYRIALAGYDTEHTELEAHGWTAREWYRPGFMKGGMANIGASDEDGERGQQKRERIWLSPHCIGGSATDTRQGSLFA
jgi:site-specific DNA-adenine methylase